MAAVRRNSLHRTQLLQRPAGGGRAVDAAAVVVTPMPSWRRQPVIVKELSSPFGTRCAKAVGETVAECAAVCCCCPCGIVNLLVLTLIRLPAALCRRAVQANAKRKAAAKSVLLSPEEVAGFGDSVAVARLSVARSLMMEEEDDGSEGFHQAMVAVPVAGEAAAEVAEMDNGILTKFFSTGFWRSRSQREEAEER